MSKLNTKKSLIIANWKMNPESLEKVRHLLGVIKRDLKGVKDVEVVLCPPFIYLAEVKSLLGKSRIKLGAQNSFWEKRGPYTGEISPLMLKDLGSEYVLVGHSERRQYFRESDKVVNKKLKAALDCGLNGVLCLGEEIRDDFDEEGKEREGIGLIIGEQLEKALEGIKPTKVNNLVVAYEPVWAIGSGRTPSSDEVMSAGLFIKRILMKLYGREKPKGVRILYGGSVDWKNASDFVKGAAMDGLLVGGAGLNASEFVKIVKSLRN